MDHSHAEELLVQARSGDYTIMRILEWYPEDWSPDEERTGDRRLSERRPISFDVIEGRGHQSVRARACDISPTGVQTDSDRRPEYHEESIIPMLLLLPGRARPLRTSATVIWTRGSRAGFEFVAMSDADRLEIAEMVDRVDQTDDAIAASQPREFAWGNA